MVYWIWLTLIKGVGSKRQRSLLENIGSPKDIYDASLKQLLNCEGIGDSTARNILEYRSLDRAEAILDKCNILGIKILVLTDELYPKIAKSIEEMPVLLYYKGTLIENSTGVAIVGARRCTDYGKTVTDRAASFLARENISVISGMAKGIDSYAHTSALKEGGYTIAVLGNGLDICYPPEHRELMDEIVKNGVIISQYPPGTPANPKHFPKRNLIISAWAHKILVIEASERSGSLITANYGKEYGREVFALPDNIFNRESKGTNKLILDGSKIYLNENQLLIEDELRYKKKKIKESKKTKKYHLDEIEKNIMDVLEKAGVQTIEELSTKLSIPQMKLLNKLSLMDLEGKLIMQGSKVSSLWYKIDLM